MTPFGLSGLLAGISSFVFGFFVLLKSSDRKLARVWFLFTFSVGAWEFAGMWIGITRDFTQALWAWRLGYAFGVIWIAVFFYHFVCTFLGLKRNKSVVLNYLMGLIFLVALSTRFFFVRLDWRWNSIFFARSGPLHYAFVIWWMGLVIYSHSLLIHAYPKLSYTRQNQVKYFSLATMFGFLGGGFCFLPNFGMSFYPWGNYAVSIYPALMAMAIVRHQLMDIRVVIRKTIVYSALTAILGAMYLALVSVVSRALEGWVRTAGFYSAAAATGVIAIVFHPLQVRLQRWVDRRFPGESIDRVFLREATGRFVHEIKRPLAKITLPIQLALTDLEDLQAKSSDIDREKAGKLKKRLEFILAESMGAARRMEAIQAVSAEESAQELTDITAVLEQTLSVYEEDFKIRAIIVEKRISPGLPKIMGHREQLEVVFSNIIRNAIDALSEMAGNKPRRLVVEAALKDSSLELRISDNGPGIAPPDLSRVFEPYFSSKGSKGMGLGLYLVDQIMRQHHGSVEARNDEGATFILRFPLTK